MELKNWSFEWFDIGLKQVLKSVEEQSSDEALRELEQIKLPVFFLIVFGLYLTFGRKIVIYNMKSRSLGLKKLPSC